MSMSHVEAKPQQKDDVDARPIAHAPIQASGSCAPCEPQLTSALIVRNAADDALAILNELWRKVFSGAKPMSDLISMAIANGNEILFGQVLDSICRCKIAVDDPERVVNLLDEAFMTPTFHRYEQNRVAHLHAIARNTRGTWVRMIRAVIFRAAASVANIQEASDMVSRCVTDGSLVTPDEWSHIMMEVVIALSLERVRAFVNTVSVNIGTDYLNWDIVAEGLAMRTSRDVLGTYNLAFWLASRDKRFSLSEAGILNGVSCWGHALMVYNESCAARIRSDNAMKRKKPRPSY